MLQYPLARYIRSIQQTSDAGERYVMALEASEVLAMVLGMSAAAWLRHVNALPDRLSALAASYEKGVAFGVWLDIARRTAKVAAGRDDAPPALTAFSTSGTKEKLAGLDVLVQERNRQAHGYRPRTDVEAERRLADVLPALATALDGATDLRSMPWVVTDSSSYRAKDRMFDVTGRRIMSDHPAFEPERWRVGIDQPMEDRRVYIRTEQTGPIDLTPFVVVRTCDTCLTEELFHSARLPRSGGTELKSFTSGHPETDPALDEDIRALGA